MHNFVDNNTITALSETIQDLINTVQNKTGRVIQCMENNDMIVTQTNLKLLF